MPHRLDRAKRIGALGHRQQDALGNGHGIPLSVAGVSPTEAVLTLVDEQREHRVAVRLPAAEPGPVPAATLS